MPKLNMKELEDCELSLIIAPSDDVQKVNLQIMKHFMNKRKSSCVYLTIAKPYNTVLNILKKNKVSTGNIFFIDCITSLSTGGDMQRSGNAVFCQPQSLTNISIVLTSAIESLSKEKNKLLLMDTLSTLLIYNEAGTVTKFVHSLASRLRGLGVKSIIFTLEEETDKKIISQISQFVDKTIRL